MTDTIINFITIFSDSIRSWHPQREASPAIMLIRLQIASIIPTILSSRIDLHTHPGSAIDNRVIFGLSSFDLAVNAFQTTDMHCMLTEFGVNRSIVAFRSQFRQTDRQTDTHTQRPIGLHKVRDATDHLIHSSAIAYP